MRINDYSISNYCINCIVCKSSISYQPKDRKIITSNKLVCISNKYFDVHYKRDVSMMYSKAQQLGKRFKPKRKNRTEIKPRDRQKALDYWGNGCLYCQSPNVALHHVKYRSGMGTGRWRNLIPLCQPHHDKVHQDESIRKSLEMLLEQEFGIRYWMDEWDLYERGLIDHPTVGEYEKYFEGVNENGES